MPFIQGEDGAIFYEVSGTRRWLVLIPGAWTTHRWWRWQVTELSRDYRVLTLDVRGYGQSSPLHRAWSVDLLTSTSPSTVIKSVTALH